MLEAMASKRLVACTDIPALRELIQDGKNGLACKAKDIKSLHEMITKVVAMTPHERQKLATKGFRTVLEKGDADKNMRLLETAFTQA
jgi:spore maturation protein CgeB